MIGYTNAWLLYMLAALALAAAVPAGAAAQGRVDAGGLSSCVTAPMDRMSLYRRYAP